jgi:phosphoglycolate phosphatase-like HAD superfamily hydrolase
MRVGAVVFDLDGVIVKTSLVKHAAMLSLFADHPEQQSAISEFILSNSGVPRRAKLTHLLQNNLRTEPTDALLSEYLSRYAMELEHQLAVAPMVDGVAEFIACYPAARYICSSAPEAEVHAQVSRRSLGRHLAAIYGGNTSKFDALRSIAASHPNQSVVFFGDSVGDYEASCQVSTAFVGVVCERDNFQDIPVVKIQDFTQRGTVEQAMLRAVAQGAAQPFVAPDGQQPASLSVHRG